MNAHDLTLDATLALAANTDCVPSEETNPSQDSLFRSRDFLSMYFKEMSSLGIMEPEEERHRAQEIERREQALWRAAFRHVATASQVIDLVANYAKQEPQEFLALRSALEACDHLAIARAADRAAAQARVLDADRELQTQLFTDLQQTLSSLSAPLEIASLQKQLRLLSRLLQRALQAKNSFVQANLRLVIGIARRFQRGRMALPDLIQEGNLGLIKAVERFDYRRGFRFSTYASWWIRHAISRALADKSRAIRLPVHMIDAYGRLARSSQEISHREGRDATSEELSKETGLSENKIERLQTTFFAQPYSLDRPVGDEDGRRFLDFIPADESSNPFETLLQEGLVKEVRQMMTNLSAVESDILCCRFGLDTDREYTLKEIGERYKLSRERIRQLQEQALGKLRVAMKRKDIL